MATNLATPSIIRKELRYRIYWISPNLNHYKKKFLSRLVNNEKIDLVVLAGQSPVEEGHKEGEGLIPYKIDRVNITKKWFGIYLPTFFKTLNAGFKGKFNAIMMPSEKRLLLLILWLFALKQFCRFKLVTYTHPFMRSSMDKVTGSDLFWTKFIFSLFDRIVFYTEESKNWALRRHLLPKSKADYANNTLDTEDIEKDYNFRVNLQNPRRILFIGRLIAKKRLDILLHYFRELKKVIPDIKLTVIGDGPDSSLIKDGMMADKGITWLGTIIDEDKIRYEMGRSHIVFVPEYSGVKVKDLTDSQPSRVGNN